MSAQKRLRIGVEATSLLGARTGIGTMTRALLQRFGTETDIEVTGLVISWRGRGEVAAALPDGVRGRSTLFPARLAHQLWSRVDWPVLSGFDVLHGPNYVAPPSGGAAELVSVHDFGPWHTPELVTAHARAYPRLVARAVARGAHVHVDSAFVGEEAKEILSIPTERVHVVRLGFDSQDGGDPSRGRALAGGHRFVLALGTVEPRKDLPTLVAAMAQLWDEDDDLRLVVAGPDGWGSDAFEAAVVRHQAGERVIRLGYVSDADRADLLVAADCLAFPSTYEGFGLPPLEAMAASTPVVTSTAGSLPEICGDAARFVAPGDVDGLARELGLVLTDQAVAAALVERGREHTQRYSWDTMATEMIELYRRLAA